MALLNPFKLEKLRIVPYATAKRTARSGPEFVAMFNPTGFTRSYASKFTSPYTIFGATQEQTFVRVAPGDVELELFLDGTNVEELGLLAFGDTVTQRLDKLISTVYAVQGNTHEPNYLRVIWGKFDIPCRLTNLSIRYTSFDRSGEPLRAELTLSLVIDDDPAKQRNNLGLSSPDLTHHREVTESDTLPLLVNAIYGSVSHHLDVARANNVNHPRSLVPGQTLRFPPLQS